MSETVPPIEPDASESAGSLFRAFDEQAFLAGSTWHRIKRILESTGGSYGLVGPRGSGKSWLMLRAIAEARKLNGIGLWFPSPSEYSSTAFLSALSDNFAEEIDKRARRGSAGSYAVSELTRARWPLVTMLTLLVSLLLAVQLSGLNGEVREVLNVALGSGAIGLLVGFGLIAIRGLRRTTTAEGRLLLDARNLKERIRYSSARQEALELGLQTSGSGVGTKIASSRQRQLNERSITLSTLIHEFRELAEQAGEVATPVVIAIDELDKMSSADDVRALLRDIKGIFEVPGVHFLVSVSYEAIRTLRLGAITRRDEFNSSFYTVLELPPLSPYDCELLLWRRWLLAARPSMRQEVTDEEIAQALDASDVDATARLARLEKLWRTGVSIRYNPRLGVILGILTGGIPREVVRLADAADGLPANDRVALENEFIAALLRAEMIEFRRQVVGALDSEVALTTGDNDERLDAEAAALGVFEALADDPLAARSRYSFRVLDELIWSPSWSSAWWGRNFAEEWRRLLVRLHVGGLLMGGGPIVESADQARAMQAIVLTASQSATFAKLTIEGSVSA